MADIEVDIVTNMEVDMVADMVVDMEVNEVADNLARRRRVPNLERR